jgi:hypothetical protein
VCSGRPELLVASDGFISLLPFGIDTMRLAPLRLVACFGLTVGAGIAVLCARPFIHDLSPIPRSTNPLPRLAITGSGVDFGRIAPGEIRPIQFTLRNAGGGVLVVQALQPSCGCAPAKLSQSHIPAGDTAVLSVEYKGQEIPAAVTHAVTFQTNDPEQSEGRVTFHGQVCWPVDADPVNLYCGPLSIGSSQDYELIITSLEGDVGIVGVTATAPFLTAAPPVSSNSTRHRLRVHVTAATPGAFSEIVEIRTTSARRPVIRVPVSGEVVGAQTVSPSRLMLQRSPPGSVVTFHLLLQRGDQVRPQVSGASRCRHHTCDGQCAIARRIDVLTDPFLPNRIGAGG